MRPAAEAIESLRQEIVRLAQSETTAKAIEGLRTELRESAEERRKSFADLELRLRRVELALVRHRVRARLLTAGCGVASSAATHMLARCFK